MLKMGHSEGYWVRSLPNCLSPQSPIGMSTDLAEKIRNQVEFYFSGLNLKRDKFMREKMAADPEGCRTLLRGSLP